MSADDWRTLAACREEDPELFFPVGTTGAAAQIEQAVAVCRRCPAIEPCRQWALDTRQMHGVWAGLTERDRRIILRRQGHQYRTTTAA